MLKRYTVNALLVGRPALIEAQKNLKSLGVASKHMDFISHVDSKENSVQIHKSHKGYVSMSYGFFIGVLVGFIICLLNESFFIGGVQVMSVEGIALTLWKYISVTSFLGAVLGFMSGRGMAQYVLWYGKGEKQPNLHYLLMVNVDIDIRDKVLKALEPIAETVDFSDNHREVELGLQAKESH